MEKEQICSQIQLKLFNKEEMRKYKMTGPTSNGKSFSLFCCSRITPKVVYINVKILKNKDKNTALKIIISEFSRLYLKDDDIKIINKETKKINLQNDIIKILLELIQIILKYNKLKLILIFDQYKKDNIQSYPYFNKEIKLLIEQNKKLKIVYCFTINDNEIRDDVLYSLEKNGRNNLYKEESQEYIFYFGELYKLKKSGKNTINYLFGNKKKYISFFQNGKKSKGDIFKEISKRIRNKIESFRASKLNNHEISSNYTFNDVLIYLKSIFDLEFEYENLFNVLRYCPLKYILKLFLMVNTLL